MKALVPGRKRLSSIIPNPQLFALPFLCPAIFSRVPFRPNDVQARCFASFGKRCLEAVAPQRAESPNDSLHKRSSSRSLPLVCPGCGAFSQTVDATQAGFYDPKRKAVRTYLNRHDDGQNEADAVYKETLSRVDGHTLRRLGLSVASVSSEGTSLVQVPPPMCDRCHSLVHYKKGEPIHHPTVEALADTIAESPHKHNHVYHVLDAADFPLSLVQGLQKRLSLSRLRSQNRRSKMEEHYKHGGTAEMSFIITRSDLLAPKKELVDKMMPLLVDILRDALGREGKNVRLGNVRCISARRGWWTKEVKDTILKQGGGGWMFGKVNVGKSNLFEAVFPKGRGSQALNVEKLKRGKSGKAWEDHSPTSIEQSAASNDPIEAAEDTRFLEVGSLLPPAPKEVPFPAMPLISSLPGTTASPIRLPFGDGRGELVDLPGLDRDTLDAFLKPERRLDTVMTSRVKPQRLTLKPGQSLLLDGLVRITPSKPADNVFMTHCFVPLAQHVTATAKALEMEAGEREHPFADGTIADLERIRANGNLQSAGKFKLEWDVTKQHAGPLVKKAAVGLKPERLGWRTYAADILIAGCGWIEVVAEVRKHRPTNNDSKATYEHDPHSRDAAGSLTDELSEMTLARPSSTFGQGSWAHDQLDHFPEIEVFAPQGKFIGIRRPLNAWLVGGAEAKPKRKGQSGRPRRSMSSFKDRRQSKTSA